MNLTINGEPRDLPEPISVAALLEQLDLAGKHVAVEVNRELVPKRDHDTHQLADGDRLEIVTLVGGG
jgi:sulfur carrier protein